MSHGQENLGKGLLPVFAGATANDVWSSALSQFEDSGSAVVQTSRDGATRELLHAALVVVNPRQRWIPARQPALNPAFAIAEALWMIWGRNDAALPVYFSERYRKFNGPGPIYEGAYGHRLRAAFGLDQLRRAADALIGAPDSRQVVLQIWDASDDLPNADGSARRKDIPCNLLSMLKLRDNRLHWTQIIRSNDLVLGVPYNIVQFTTIQEILAGWIGADVGPYIQISDSLHMYERDVRISGKANVAHAHPNIDDLALPMANSAVILGALQEVVDILIQPDLDRVAFERAVDLNAFPTAYRNLVAIMSAESARRRRWSDASKRLSEACTNPALRQLWAAWWARFAKSNSVMNN